MKLNFKNLTIHNFLSIGDASISLNNRGYVLVEGINNNINDNALSNGSGKSSIWNALCWCLTGETIQGLKTNIPNIYGEDGCFVELLFNVDNDEYKITRYREYKSIKNDLKIFINGEDKSGKGLRESEVLLNQYLPDLTPDLIGNVILLGQGLPHKFSNNTPSGRKELLENLSKSDFMISDIKGKVAKRTTIVEDLIRKSQDNLLVLNTKQTNLNQLIETNKQKLSNLNDEETRNLLVEAENDKTLLEQKLNNLNNLVAEVKISISESQEDYKKILNAKNDNLVDIKNRYADELNNSNNIINEYKVNINVLEKEINKLDSVPDICPTCGQKMPADKKIDTTERKEKLKQLKADLDVELKHNNDINTELNNKLNIIVESFDIHIVDNEKTTNNLNTRLKQLEQEQNDLNKQFINNETNIASYKAILNNFETNKKTLIDDINNSEQALKDVNQFIKETDDKLLDLNEHLDVLSKINTLIKRDFRGVLLTNVIEFINNKVKTYCKYVFNTDRLEIYLDGNNLNIEFCGKMYENLSGGEKQKVDLVTQFAIRDLMCKYLGFNSSIIIIDEIFDNLDANGCTGVLNLISNILTDVDSLFIISHHSDSLAIPYDDKITVIKDETGVSKVN